MNELMFSKNDLLLLVCRVLDNLLYISFLLFVNINSFSRNDKETTKACNTSKLSIKQSQNK